MAKVNVKNLIEEITKDFLVENNLELWNVEFQKEGRDWFLRIYVDKSNPAEGEYVSTDDCELVSRFVNDKLDELDPIEQNYYLEVCSPGMDRQLIKQEHYDRYKGSLVDVKLYSAVEGRKNFKEVTLEERTDEALVISIDDKKIELPIDKVAKTNLSIVF